MPQIASAQYQAPLLTTMTIAGPEPILRSKITFPEPGAKELAADTKTKDASLGCSASHLLFLERQFGP